MEMSEATEVFEITDSSLNVDNLDEKSLIEQSKRRLSPEIEEEENKIMPSPKKFKDVSQGLK